MGRYQKPVHLLRPLPKAAAAGGVGGEQQSGIIAYLQVLQEWLHAPLCVESSLRYLHHPVGVQGRMKGGKQSRGEIDYDFVESGCTGITAMRFSYLSRSLAL